MKHTPDTSDEKDEKPGEKTRVVSFRIPTELYDQLQELKHREAHPMIADTAFVIEAIRLYVTLGAHYGLDKKLQVENTAGKLSPSSKKSARGGSGSPSHPG
jgi:hypothetical protein